MPCSAVIDDGSQALVYVERGAGLFDARVVTLGARCGAMFPVVAGLEPGDRVAAQGAFLIDAETRLNPSLATGYFGAAKVASAREPAAPVATKGAGEEAWVKDSPRLTDRAALAEALPGDGKAPGLDGCPAQDHGPRSYRVSRCKGRFPCCRG